MNNSYKTHLATLQASAERALARTGFDALLIASGVEKFAFLDDRSYLFQTNPHFKHWLPLTRVPDSWIVYTPGKRPQLIFNQPRDYWHVVPAAPSGWWVEHFDIHIIREPEQALALLPADPARCAILGEANSTLGGFAPDNPAAVIDHLHWHRSFKTPYEIALMRHAQVPAVRAHRAAEAGF